MFNKENGPKIKIHFQVLGNILHQKSLVLAQYKRIEFNFVTIS